jgi:hypothetical protein
MKGDRRTWLWLSPWIFVSVVHVVKSLVLCIMFCKSLFVFFFAIIWSVLLQFTTSNNHFAVFKLFMWKSKWSYFVISEWTHVVLEFNFSYSQIKINRSVQEILALQTVITSSKILYIYLMCSIIGTLSSKIPYIQHHFLDIFFLLYNNFLYFCFVICFLIFTIFIRQN